MWRPTNKLRTFYIFYEKHEGVKIDPLKIYLLGRLGQFVDLDKPSLYDRWQIKLRLDDGIVSHVEALLEIGPFPVSMSKEITVSVRTNDPGLKDYEGLDLNGPFPFIHEWGVSEPSPTDPGLSSDRFVEGTQVVVKCLFTAYNIKGRTGYSFKLLEIYRLGHDLDDELVPGDASLFPKKRTLGPDLDDGLVLGDAPLFLKKKKIDKSKGREV
jgi:hypothetical protein